MVFLLPATALAQDTGTIAGVVTDSTEGGPIPGANLVISELSVGAASGADGSYEITGVPSGEYQLSASFVGYQTSVKTVTVEAGETTQVDFMLAPQTVGMQDVVVTALGVERSKRSLGYSVGEVDGAALAEAPEPNFVSSLSGRVAGASVSTGNALGGSSRIILRGAKSVDGDNQPLFVVDGVVINNSNFQSDQPGAGGQQSGGGGYDYGNAASFINPNDIESVSVLKGPAAAALYGSRGSNGVVQISTKKGSSGDVRVNFTSGVRFQQVYGLPEYQNTYGGGSFAPFATLDGDRRVDGPDDQFVADYGTDESWGPRMDGRDVRQWYSWDNVDGLEGQMTPWSSNPNNVENFFRTGTTYDNYISLSTGSEDYQYRLSYGNLSQSGVYPESQLSRNQVGFNGSFDFTEKLSATASGQYIYTDARGRPGTGYSNNNVFLQFNHFGQRQVDLGEGSRMANFERPGGAQRGWNWNGISGAQSGNFKYTDNPYWVRNRNFQSDDTQRFFGKVQLDYALTEEVGSSFEVVTDHRTERREERNAIGTAGIASFTEDVYDVEETSAELSFDYQREINEDISVDGFVAGRARFNNYDRNYGQTNAGLSAPGVFTLENSVDRPDILDDIQEQEVYSVYGSANVGWRDLVYFQGTLRNDWSSTLPSDENSYIYPSAQLSFVFSSLESFQSQDILSYGKVRASWAQVGNDTNPYQLATTFPVQTPYQGNPIQEVSRTLNNSDLKPEITTGYEFGTDLEFFNNRVSLGATYYIEETKDQILNLQVSRASGFEEAVINAGSISNRGLEVDLGGTPVMTESFQWDLSVNWAKNVSKVEELGLGVDSYVLGGTPFGPDIVAQVGRAYGAIYGSDYVYDAEGNKFMDQDASGNGTGQYLASSDNKNLGSYLPDWQGGVSTTLSYEGLSVSALVRGQKGGSVYSLSNLFGLYSGIYGETSDGSIRELGLIPDGVVLPSEEEIARQLPADADIAPSDITAENAAEYGITGNPVTTEVAAVNYFKSLFSGPDAGQVYDATFVKLQEVTVSYELPRRWLDALPVRTLRVTAIGRNLATLYQETPNFDPENAISATNVQGLEVGQIPPQRAFGFRLNLGF